MATLRIESNDAGTWDILETVDSNEPQPLDLQDVSAREMQGAVDELLAAGHVVTSDARTVRRIGSVSGAQLRGVAIL